MRSGQTLGDEPSERLLSRQAFNVGGGPDNTLSLLEHQLQKAGVEIHTDMETELPPIYGNAGKLQQVFLNLFLNARDAMPVIKGLSAVPAGDPVS